MPDTKRTPEEILEAVTARQEQDDCRNCDVARAALLPLVEAVVAEDTLTAHQQGLRKNKAPCAGCLRGVYCAKGKALYLALKKKRPVALHAVDAALGEV